MSSNYTSLGQPLYYSSGCQSGGGYSGSQGTSTNGTNISIKYNGDSTKQEARPENFTCKIWVRTA